MAAGSDDDERAGADGDLVDMLVRWELFGGSWRVLDRVGSQVTISLRRCDGGEEHQRLVGDDPALTAWLGDRTSSTPIDTCGSA